jgi:hypothetical protein
MEVDGGQPDGVPIADAADPAISRPAADRTPESDIHKFMGPCGPRGAAAQPVSAIAIASIHSDPSCRTSDFKGPSFARQHRVQRLRYQSATSVACQSALARTFCMGLRAFGRARLLPSRIEVEIRGPPRLGRSLALPSSCNPIWNPISQAPSNLCSPQFQEWAELKRSGQPNL